MYVHYSSSNNNVSILKNITIDSNQPILFEQEDMRPQGTLLDSTVWYEQNPADVQYMFEPYQSSSDENQVILGHNPFGQLTALWSNRNPSTASEVGNDETTGNPRRRLRFTHRSH